ncbi:MAG: tRNA(adenine34) deaminase [Acidimicrobiaceae bacterium]|jgi:tRNA(Arg) A34 adenosine deaminase TadA
MSVSALDENRERAAEQWRSLDAQWLEAFRQAWEAFRTGNIGVGACVAQPDGRIVATSRNRVADAEGPIGEMFGTSVAHAELNALAHLPFRHPREFILTTTLRPCLQCSAAIRMAPIAVVRIAGADPLWDGCSDFTGLAPWLARRGPVPTEGPRSDEVGAFGVLLSRFGLGLMPAVEEALRELGDGDIIDVVQRLESTGRSTTLAALDLGDAFVEIWPDLHAACASSSL